MQKYSFVNFDGELVEVEMTKEMQDVIDDYNKNEDREAKRYKRNTDLCDRSIYENHIMLSENSVEQKVDENKFLKWLDEALIICTEIQTRRFKMFLFNSMTYEEIARHENCSKTCAYQSVKQVLKKIKKHF